MNDKGDEEKEEDEADADSDIVKQMVRRLDDMKSGKDPGYTLEQAEAIWLRNIENRNAARG